MDLKRWKIFQSLDPILAADVQRAYLIGIDLSRGRRRMDCVDMLPWRGGLMVMKSGDVFSIARRSKDVELLGVEETNDLLPLVPVKIDALCGLEIQGWLNLAVSSAVRNVAVLTKDGRIYRWGEIVSDGTWTTLKPGFLSDDPGTEKIVQIASGQMHTLALTEQGELYSWGGNRVGQLGIGSTTFDDKDPKKVSENCISGLRWMDFLCFGLDNEGNVWSWGNHGDHALGYESSKVQFIPEKFWVRNIQKIAAGNTHVLALSNEKELYFWGGHDENFATTLMKIEMEIVVDIGVTRGCSISAFKTDEGSVYFWGLAYGLDIPDPVVTRFSSMEELFASLDTPLMLKPVELNDKEPMMVAKFKKGFDDKETSDFSFCVDGKQIYAHKMVLKLRSDYFRKIFENNWKESTENKDVLEIADFTYGGFRKFLFYLYTERVEPPLSNAEDAIELFKLADYYGEGDLKFRCEQQLELLSTVHNVCEVYSIAVLYNVKILHDLAMKIVIPNLHAVVKSDGYKGMSDLLKLRLIQELPDEEDFAPAKSSEISKSPG